MPSTSFNRYAIWLALPFGAALSLAFEPFDISPLAIFCPAFLFLSWRDASPKRAAQIGFLFTSGTYLAGTYWLYNSVYVIGQTPLPIAIFLMLALVATMGAYMAIVGYCQARWLPKSGYARYLVALPVAWVLLEWIRGWLFSGFPWLALGYSSVGHPLGYYAPIVGVYGVSLMYAVTAGALAGWTVQHESDERQPHNRGAESSFRKSAIKNRWMVVALGMLLVPNFVPIFIDDIEWTQPTGREITVAIVQGAVSQEMKWTPQQHDATLELYRELTVPHWGTDLIVWPESALPNWADALADYLSNLWQEARVHRSDMLIGQIRVDEKDGKPYNSVLGLSDNVQWYDKHHLVPFGEYFPVPAFMREWLRLMSLPHSDFTSGAKVQPALQVAGQKVAVTICYEDAFAATQLPLLKEATLLVNVTNDAWFGASTARHQHLQISRMRALEAGRPLLRAANDGISAIIDSRGEVVSQLPSFESAVLTGIVQPRSGLTPYARTGNWPVVSWCIALLAAMVWWTRRMVGASHG